MKTIRKIIRNIFNTENILSHTISMTIGIAFLFASIMAWITFDRLDTLEQKFDAYQDDFSYSVHAINMKLVEVDQDQTTVKVNLAELEQQIESNTIEIDNNRTRIIENKIDADEVSWTSFKFVIGEIWAELELLRKAD